MVMAAFASSREALRLSSHCFRPVHGLLGLLAPAGQPGQLVDLVADVGGDLCGGVALLDHRVGGLLDRAGSWRRRTAAGRATAWLVPGHRRAGLLGLRLE